MVMGSNPGYLPKSFLIYATFLRLMYITIHSNAEISKQFCGHVSYFLLIFGRFQKTFVLFVFRYEWQTFPGRLWSSLSLPSPGYTQTLWTRPEISPWGYPGICQSGWPFGVRKPEGRYGMSTLRYNWMAWRTFTMGHRRWWKVNIF